MSNSQKSLNDIAWEKLFAKYDILNHIEKEKCFKISSSDIKEYREPRLMAKFDHTVNLPSIFANNDLAILPITRGDYIISHFNAYHNFESDTRAITRVSLPEYIQSLNSNIIPSETIALNCAVASGIVKDFLDDEEILPTVSGRMGSGNFNFKIQSCLTTKEYCIEVNNSQIEIDAAYEGLNSLAIFEAKRDISEDFLIRQLYYPYRVWSKNVTKPVRPLFLVYSNGIYRLYEYKFQEPNNYNSLTIIKQKKYSIEDSPITTEDISNVLQQVKIIQEPAVTFPQADSFDRVINICELLNERDLNRSEVTEEYLFNSRQTNYYTDAARYLGLITKGQENFSPTYSLSKTGKQILDMNFKQRQLAYCSQILCHKVFNTILRKCFNSGSMPSTNEIVNIMKTSNLYSRLSDSTYARRASTIKSWIYWIISLIDE